MAKARSLQQRLSSSTTSGLGNKKGVYPLVDVVLTIIFAFIMATIMMNWSQDIAPPEAPKQFSVSITRQNEFNGSITVSSIIPTGTKIEKFLVKGEKGTAIETVSDGSTCKIPDPNYDAGVCEEIGDRVRVIPILRFVNLGKK